jgi:hypothetical protein
VPAAGYPGDGQARGRRIDDLHYYLLYLARGDKAHGLKQADFDVGLRPERTREQEARNKAEK